MADPAKCAVKCDICPLATILEELEQCDFLGEGGLLQNHRGFLALKKLASEFGGITLEKLRRLSETADK